jgi:hypothetical protein
MDIREAMKSASGTADVPPKLDHAARLRSLHRDRNADLAGIGALYERKLVLVRKYRGTIRFFKTHRTLFSSADHRHTAKSKLAYAERRARQLERTIVVLRAKVRKRDARRWASLPPRAAICNVFGSYCEEAVAVASCESRLQTTAQNGQYLGLFQMGSYERRLFGHGSSAREQALAAHRYFLRSGRDWSPWSCSWAAA